jgi:hypothetical protein
MVHFLLQMLQRVVMRALELDCNDVDAIDGAAGVLGGSTTARVLPEWYYDVQYYLV